MSSPPIEDLTPPREVKELFEAANEETTTLAVMFTERSAYLVDVSDNLRPVREVPWDQAGKYREQLLRHIKATMKEQGK